AGNNVFNISSTSSVSSTSQVTYWLKDEYGDIVDAFSSNGASFPTSSGVTPSDFTGSLMGGSGKAGCVRLIADNNLPSDWLLTSATPSSFGAGNNLPPQGGPGCLSNRVQMIVVVTGQPADDVSAYKLLSPASALNLSTSETVQFRVRNYGTAAQDTIPVGYTISNGPIVVDTIFANVLPNDSIDFTFSTPADLSISDSTYILKVFTALSADVNQLNDTVSDNITNMLPNYCNCYATSAAYEDITGVSIGLWSNTSPASGHGYTDFTSLSSMAFISPSMSYPVSVSSDFPPGYSYQYTCYTNVFIDFNRDGDYTDPGELVYGAATTSSYTVSGTFTVPPTALSGVTHMRVVLRQSGNAANTGPCGTYSWGETEDYKIMVAPPIPKDAGVILIANPTTVSSSPNTTINVDVMNFGTDTIFSLDVSYVLNGGTPVTMTYATSPMAPLDVVSLNLGAIMLNDGANSICTYTTLANDSNDFNDTICTSTYLQATVTLSYNDDFEGPDLWMPDTLLNQWERGIPSAANINTAHSPVNVWAIDLDDEYDNSSDDYLYTPRFVTTGLDSAILEFWQYFETMINDGGAIEVSIDAGPWITLGLSNNDPMGTNWYNTTIGGNPFWSGNSGGWIESTYKIMLNNTTFNNPDTVQFRFYFHSNGSNSADGWAIDDFGIELVKIPQDAGVIAINSPLAAVQVGSSVAVDVTVKN
ncbi:MAG: hypothetical protein KAH32_06190, partial [Chlamydiia bacterium]|nr:hypothetical protein [Chlamydiia bacterium]